MLKLHEFAVSTALLPPCASHVLSMLRCLLLCFSFGTAWKGERIACLFPPFVLVRRVKRKGSVLMSWGTSNTSNTQIDSWVKAEWKRRHFAVPLGLRRGLAQYFGDNDAGHFECLVLIFISISNAQTVDLSFAWVKHFASVSNKLVCSGAVIAEARVHGSTFSS
jgi:hypothetical protein